MAPRRDHNRWTSLRTRHGCASFVRGEDGSVLVLGVFIFVIMMVAGGMAVDFMRAERERAELQYALDRALLASAALNQPLNSEAVLRDYLSKTNTISDYELVVDSDRTLTASRVSARLTTKVDSLFLNMLGINSLEVQAGGTAEERVQNIEISLVLDVSGSMGNNNKLRNMQTAAVEFVETLLTDQNRDRVSITLIPYNMQVNAGPDILGEMRVTSEHSQSHCLDFTTAQYGQRGISQDTYQRTGHFDPFRTTIDHPNTSSDDNDSRVFMCPTSTASEIMLVSQNVERLSNRINALRDGGNTSIDIGVKWGAIFLDDSAQSIVDAVGGSQSIDEVFQNRPAPYSDPDTVKIMVVMTDGINTTQYELAPDYRSGASNVWFDPDSTILSIWDDRNREYFVTNTYDNNYYGRSSVYGDRDGDGRRERNRGEYRKWEDGPFGRSPIRLTWPQVWAMMSTRYNAYYNQYEMRNWNSEYYDWRDRVVVKIEADDKDDRLHDACQTAKSNGVVIFAIGFEVTDDSAQVMETCASSTSHFFRVEGVEISDAFNAIAQTIQRLKLTQ